MAEYIERASALRICGRLRDKNTENYDMAFALNWAMQSIERIPAADVMPVRHGRWEWEFPNNGWANLICSECGYTKNTDIHVRLGYRFCPNCGARMDGDGE